ncbi:extracellular solute-binding protein [Bifidobacterium sp. ESL0690]|uniref:ABC transporter substrate-binding protein n=1 Tax=Bifidobacterium sp. ESL0690 TaxID=2983214 RepID=UPI0023F811D4|nr:extracellular solute-binding protein [Bifidobacterium sp. ESL0690]WEV46068.1 extracellular solute-binding protein [Bifidobacterium sp. ESL0690]
MNKKMKKVIALTAAAAVSLGLFGACGNPAASSDSTDTSAKDYWPNPTGRLDGVKLTMWGGAEVKSVPAQVIKDFEKQTGAKINQVTVPDVYENNAQTKVTTGDVPDVAFWQPTASMLAGFVSQNKLQKLDNSPFVKNYKKGIAESGGSYKGHRYGVMISAPSVFGVYYNKDVFKKAGIESTPKNWDEFVTTAQKIKDANVPGVESPLFEMGGSQWGTQWAVQAQLAEASKGGLYQRISKHLEKFTDPTYMKAITNYKSLFDKGLYNSDAGSAKDTEQEAALWQGKTSMIFGNNSQFLAIAALAGKDKQALDSKIGYFGISSKGNISSIIPDGSNGIVAFKTGDAKREAAARQFLNFWMSDKEYTKFVGDQNIVSALKTVKSPADVPQAMLDASNSIATGAGSMQSEAIANPDLYINLANMVNGTMTPKQVAQTTQDQFDQVAKAQGAKGF